MEASLKSVTAALGTLRVGAADSEERLHEQAAEACAAAGRMVEDAIRELPAGGAAGCARAARGRFAQKHRREAGDDDEP